MFAIRRKALTRLAIFCLGTSALTAPVLAASFSVGGGTITTTQADNSADSTGSGGGFNLQANTLSAGDAITVSNVTINSSSARPLDVGGTLASTGSYSVTMHGTTLTGGGWFQSSGGTISFDSTGGASNTMSGDIGLTVANGMTNGGTAINLGADNISANIVAVQTTGQGSGTIAIDMAATTITSSGSYGVVAQNGFGNITIGGLSGGISGHITANSGYGIYSSSNGTISVTIAPSGSVTALNGMWVQGNASIVDNYGTISASNIAVDASFANSLALTLRSGSTTSGTILGSNGADTLTLFGGATITGATFNGSSGSDTLVLTGSGNGNLAVNTVSNVETFQKTGTGNWTLTGTTAAITPWTITAGTLMAPNDAALGNTSGSVTFNGGMLQFGGGTTARNYVVQAGGGTFSAGDPNVSAAGNETTISGTISGPGHLTFTGFGGLTLTGNNAYTGGTTIYEGAIVVGDGGTAGSIIGDVVSGVGTANAGINFNRSDNVTFSGNISGLGYLAQYGSGTLTLTGNNTYGAYTTILSGRLAFSSDANVGAGNIKIYSGIAQYNTSFVSARNYEISGGAMDTNGNTVTLTGNIFTMTGTNIAAGYGGITKLGAGTLILAGSDTYQGQTLISNGTLQIGNGGTTGSTGTNSSIIDNAALVFNRSDSISFGGVISGSGSLTQAGSGTLTLTGNNSYTGSTTISAGAILRIGNGGTSGMIVGGIANSGTLIFNRSDSLTFANAISGTGSVTQAGVGSVTLAGNNTYSGGTTVSSGTLQIGNGGTSGTITGNINDNGALIFNRSDTVIFGGAISGSGSMTQAGGGTVILTGASTYTGGTTINGGSTLQVGNGGTSGSLPGLTALPGWVDNSGTLIFNRSDTSTFHNIVNGNGVILKQGGGTLIVAGTLNASQITVSQGALQFGNGPEDGFFNASLTDNAAVVFGYNANFTSHIGSVISGSGTVSLTGGGSVIYDAAQTYTGSTIINAGSLQLAAGSLASTGALTVNGGTFDLNGHSQTIGALSGTGGAITLGSGTLTTSSSTNSSLAATISGSGSLIKAGTGILSLTGTNTYTGGTTISGGALQIGSGGTSGSLIGNVTNNAALVFNRSDAVTFASVISGTGSVAQAGAGTLTLSSASTYTGATSVNAGTLNVTGAIAGSGVSVANGATLTGTGRVGATNIASGGTLTPGSASTPGTLSVNGNLTLASGTNYFDAVTPTASSLTSVTGPASINGSFAASLASGTYTLGQRYTVLTASGGVSGTFASLSTVGIPTYVRGRLSYDPNNVYLNLDPNVLAPSLSNASANQHGVVSAIDAAVLAGGTPTGGFLTLYGLSGSALNSALDQISGQIGPNTTNAVGQGSLSFLTMTGAGGSGSGNFAPGSAYGSADAPHRAQLGSGETRIWGSVYGGHVGLSADAASGAAGLSASNVGFIGGADMGVDDGLLAGVTVGFGRQNFSSGNGTGDSDDVMIGLYARKDAGPLYVSAAFGYGWHQITTQRVITIAGTDILQGKQDADDFGGRIEAGWHMALDDEYTLSPYAAVAAESFEAPAYAETAVSGASTFALSVAAHSSTLGRSELGAGLARNYQTDSGVLAADVRLAWAHQLDDLPFTQASFQGLPGASFVVTGVRPASDTALLGAGFELRQSSGLFFGVKGESQLGAGTTILEGMGNLGWRW
jgi:autotransporter-associated beta strand protein